MDDGTESKGEENESPSATPSTNVEESKPLCDRSSNSPTTVPSVYPQSFEVRDISKNQVEHENRHFLVASHTAGGEEEEEEEGPESVNENYPNVADDVYNSEEFITAADIRDDESVFACKYPQCNFRTLDADTFLKHEDLHVDGKSYECDVCHMKFALFASMRRHKSSHFGGRPFECRLCAKRFFRREHLMEHVVRQHSKQRPYRCPFCVKSFNSRPHLKSHLSSDHTAIVQDRICRICGYKSTSTNNAQVHFTLCHLKQPQEISDMNVSRSSHSFITIAQNHPAAPENEAVDLGAISQNFSFLPPHYSAFAYATTESSLAGPSEPSNLITRLAQSPTPCAQTSVVSRESRILDHVDPSPVSSLASSTTAGNSALCRNNTPNENSGENPSENATLTRISIKPEPPEVVIEDSQNSNVQPTSTMDLTMNVVETTCTASDAQIHHPCSSNYVQSGKMKNSSGDEAGSERPHSPSAGRQGTSHDNQCWSTDSASNTASRSKCHSRYKEAKCRQSSYCSQSRISRSDSSAKRYRNQELETCNKNMRIVSNNLDGYAAERKFTVRENVPVSTREVHLPEEASHHQTPVSHHVADVPHTSKVEIEDSFTIDDKSTLALTRIEQTSLMCPYCGIAFPDQTLYFLHRSLHTETSPWKCNLCGRHCKDKYDFNSHIISQGHH